MAPHWRELQAHWKIGLGFTSWRNSLKKFGCSSARTNDRFALPDEASSLPERICQNGSHSGKPSAVCWWCIRILFKIISRQIPTLNIHSLQDRWSVPCAPVSFCKASAANYGPFWPLCVPNEVNLLGSSLERSRSDTTSDTLTSKMWLKKLELPLGRL